MYVNQTRYNNKYKYFKNKPNFRKETFSGRIDFYDKIKCQQFATNKARIQPALKYPRRP